MRTDDLDAPSSSKFHKFKESKWRHLFSVELRNK